MIYAVAVLLLVVLGGLVYLSRLPGEYRVRRSLPMDVPRAQVFDKVRDLSSWRVWSPWLLHEPETSLEFSDGSDQEGGWYTWSGQYVGAGKLTHERFVGDERIEQKIEFTKPFKSVCRVWWEFAEQDGQTEVSWCMEGKMPFLFRFMTETTSMMIGKDYDLGLAMLRGVLDPDAERPLVDFRGEIQRAPQTALTLPFKGDLSAMIEAMQSGFPQLLEYARQQGISPAGPHFTAYHKVDPKAMYFECDLALPVVGPVDAGEFALKEFAGGRYFETGLQGSYDFLELAWYSTMSHLRMVKLRQDGSRPSLEVYANDPDTLESSNEIVTQIYVPLK